MKITIDWGEFKAYLLIIPAPLVSVLPYFFADHPRKWYGVLIALCVGLVTFLLFTLASAMMALWQTRAPRRHRAANPTDAADKTRQLSERQGQT